MIQKALPNSVLCAQCLVKLKLKMLRFCIRKGFLIKKVPTQNMGDLMVPLIHLAYWTGLRVF